jgi:hypothetical protein
MAKNDVLSSNLRIGTEEIHEISLIVPGVPAEIRTGYLLD